MKVGDLVKIQRPRVGIPKGTLGLVIRRYRVSYGDITSALYEVRVAQHDRTIRLYEHDVEVIKKVK